MLLSCLDRKRVIATIHSASLHSPLSVPDYFEKIPKKCLKMFTRRIKFHLRSWDHNLWVNLKTTSGSLHFLWTSLSTSNNRSQTGHRIYLMIFYLLLKINILSTVRLNLLRNHNLDEKMYGNVIPWSAFLKIYLRYKREAPQIMIYVKPWYVKSYLCKPSFYPDQRYSFVQILHLDLKFYGNEKNLSLTETSQPFRVL